MLSWGFVELRLNYSRNLAFIGLGLLFKNIRSTHITEEHLFSMFPSTLTSILTFDFDLILGSFLTF